MVNASAFRSGLHAKDIRLHERYTTRIEEGYVVARVVRIAPKDSKQRNHMFECINDLTGEYLPRLKRAADLKAILPWTLAFQPPSI